MKKEDLKNLGLTDEQIESVCKLNDQDMKPLETDLQKAKDDLKGAQDKLSTTQEALKKFEGVDAEALNKQIADLQENLKRKDVEHAAELAERDFNNRIKDAITAAKGRNGKAITALLDLEKLKASKNQEKDIAAALKALSEAEDSRMLFGEPEKKPVGTRDIIGRVEKTGGAPADTLHSAIAEHYNA